MENLYAPWRSSYADSTDKTKDATATSQECVFCQFLQENDDEKNFILKRYEHCFVILNKYPYNPGHIMVLPLRHEKCLDNCNSETRTQIMEIINYCTKVVQKKLHAQGVNIGLNIGKASGAGIPSHLHWHVLPRWDGDTNFLPVMANVKIISADLKEIYESLLPFFAV